MIKKAYQVTNEGLKELKVELEQLKGRRGEIADKIADAREYGDLRENAEYDGARNEQGLVESRIAEIEDIIRNADVIKSRKRTTVAVGATVEMKTKGKTNEYTLVGPVEADPISGKISDHSPMGQAMLGKKVGDKVTVTTPKGDITYTVESIN